MVAHGHAEAILNMPRMWGNAGHLSASNAFAVNNSSMARRIAVARNKTSLSGLLAMGLLLGGCGYETAQPLPVAQVEAPQPTAVAAAAPVAPPIVEAAAPVTSNPYDPLDLMAPVAPRPAHRTMADPYQLLGEELGEWHLGEWVNSERLSLADLRGQVVVVRFWTDAPDELNDSLRSLKALEQLKQTFAGLPVTFVGIYHSKGSLVEAPWETVVKRVEEHKLTLPIAYDHQWTTLGQWWRRRYDHLPTTATLVISPAGKITHVHPGPAYFPSYRETEWLCDADFRDLRAAIHEALPQNFADRK